MKKTNKIEMINNGLPTYVELQDNLVRVSKEKIELESIIREAREREDRNIDILKAEYDKNEKIKQKMILKNLEIVRLRGEKKNLQKLTGKYAKVISIGKFNIVLIKGVKLNDIARRSTVKGRSKKTPKK